MTTTPRPLCAILLPTEGDLWHSTDRAERAEAKRICGHCPLRTVCAEAGAADPRNRGVWGALDTRDRQRARGLTVDGPHPDDDNPLRDPHAPRECGTEDAYNAHRARRETCELCTFEHDARIRAQRLTVLDAAHAAGGTEVGYKTHRALKEAACAPCREAANAAERVRDAARKRRARANARAEQRQARILQFQTEQRTAVGCDAA